MINFQKKRDTLMKRHGWCRRVATLAVHIIEGIDSLDDIYHTPYLIRLNDRQYAIRLLLSIKEEKQIKGVVAQLVEQRTFNP